MAKRSKRSTAKSNGASPATQITQWAAITGRWSFESGTAVFKGPEQAGTTQPIGLALGAPPFRDGQVRTRIKIARNSKTTAGIAVGFTSLNAPHILVQVGAYDRAYAITEFNPGFGFAALASAGLLTNVDPAVEHDLTVDLQGQNLSMTVDAVNVLNVLLRQPLEGRGVGLFAWGDAEIVFRETELHQTRPRVFVIMPFAEPFDTLYCDVIKPVAQDQLGFEIVRIDEIQAPGMILEDIQQRIASSHAVVAEISARNPNVFYELGYAHALEKPAILLVRRQDSGEVPFDIKPYRAIHYDDSIGGKKVVERNLRAHLEAIRRGVVSSQPAG